MTRPLSQRHWLLFVIAVLASIAYLAAVESMPAGIRASLKALPLVWLIPAIACCTLYPMVWHSETMTSRAKYLRIAAYGLSAPAVAVLLIAVLYTWVAGANP